MDNENRDVSMTVTTTITISHEEMHELKLTDSYMKNLGYVLKATTSWGKTFEKIFWSNSIKTLEE